MERVKLGNQDFEDEENGIDVVACNQVQIFQCHQLASDVYISKEGKDVNLKTQRLVLNIET